jgi:hypothetical protein
MKHTFGIDSDTGGFMLLDLTLMRSVTDDIAQCLNIIFDPEGKTCAVEDYPDEDWSSVWHEADDYLAKLPDHDRRCIVLSADGLNFVRIQDEALTEDESKAVQETWRGRIRIASGRLAAIDGMHFFDVPEGIQQKLKQKVDPTTSNYACEVMRIPNGLYGLAIHHMAWHGASGTVGVFGTPDHPAFVMELLQTPFMEGESESSVAPFDTAAWNKEPRAGLFCNARCTSVRPGEGRAELLLTSHVSSGRARFAMPSGVKVAVGDSILLELKEDKGSYWMAEMPPD